MIIEEIRLRNVGVYRGEHSLRLEPVSKAKPLIIIGALNGGGKTTLLDAMQLALYGRLGSYASRGDGAYDDFLRRTISRGTPAGEIAQIDLIFRQAREGVEQRYQVTRSWYAADGKIRENFEVQRDGVVDRLLSEHWYEYIDEVLPVRIAPLFFFDGEKVVELADVKRAPALLQVAVQSLLGLDLVRQLRSDLGVLGRRKRSELASVDDRSKIEVGQAELDNLERKYEVAFQAQAGARSEVDQATAKLEAARRAFREGGGELFEQRSAIEARVRDLERAKANVEVRLREIAAGVLPLVLVRQRIARIEHADQSELAAQSHEAVLSTLDERDQWVIKLLSQKGIPQDVVSALRGALSKERDSRRDASSAAKVYRFSDEGRAGLRAATRTALDEAASKAQGLRAELNALLIEIGDAERMFQAIPDSEGVSHLLKAVTEADGRLAEANVKLLAETANVAGIQAQLDIVRRNLVRALEAEIELHHEGDDAERMLRFIGKSLETLGRFELGVVKHHIGRLEGLVLTAFNALVRKKGLVSRVVIDPETFALTLSGQDGEEFSMERLSAGERQLLAVSLLWGLANASGRAMPTVIDTPLSRLDSAHRTNLVKRYFPKASHQVILLSTDTEIAEDYYRVLKPFVSRSYTLAFDPVEGRTNVQDGFAFQGKSAP